MKLRIYASIDGGVSAPALVVIAAKPARAVQLLGQAGHWRSLGDFKSTFVERDFLDSNTPAPKPLEEGVWHRDGGALARIPTGTA